MTRWVALVRGINVGGSNRLPMAALRTTLESLGYRSVQTYIQSGNVVVDAADEFGEDDVARAISVGIADRHGLSVPVVVRSAADLARAADRHPAADGDLDPKLLHVAFLDRHPDPADVATFADDRFQPDAWMLSGRELYLTYPNGSGRSAMTVDRFERAWGVVATARNLNTVRRLVTMSAT